MIYNCKVTLHYFIYTKITALVLLKKEEGNVLFNDALNTFYLWLYGIIHIAREETVCHH